MCELYFVFCVLCFYVDWLHLSVRSPFVEAHWRLMTNSSVTDKCIFTHPSFTLILVSVEIFSANASPRVLLSKGNLAKPNLVARDPPPIPRPKKGLKIYICWHKNAQNLKVGCRRCLGLSELTTKKAFCRSSSGAGSPLVLGFSMGTLGGEG